MDEPPLWPA